MNDWLPSFLLAALALVGVLCALALVQDLRTGTSRLAHESHDVRRDELPLNFWLGVFSKAAGAVTALVAGIAVIYWLI